MLAHTSRAPGEVVGRMQATANRGEWELTVEKVAVNAVMAGARPDYFPVILALAASNISARSSSSASAMVVVNGPIRSEIGMNCGVGALGPYNHANATIGRAYGFLSQDGQGGSVVGETYMGSLGNGYTYNNLTFAENEERSPGRRCTCRRGSAKRRAPSSSGAAARPPSRATYGEEPMASKLKAAPEELIPTFDIRNINVVVVGGEANGYWQIMGATYRTTVSIDTWR
jgi:hypothetical protein